MQSKKEEILASLCRSPKINEADKKKFNNLKIGEQQLLFERYEDNTKNVS